jgi:MoxR-like ATPase
MQVAAYCNGRDTVTEYDCLLLEHVLWQSPEHAPKIADWLLSQLAVDDGMKQVGMLHFVVTMHPCFYWLEANQVSKRHVAHEVTEGRVWPWLQVTA